MVVTPANQVIVTLLLMTAEQLSEEGTLNCTVVDEEVFKLSRLRYLFVAIKDSELFDNKLRLEAV